MNKLLTDILDNLKKEFKISIVNETDFRTLDYNKRLYDLKVSSITSLKEAIDKTFKGEIPSGSHETPIIKNAIEEILSETAIPGVNRIIKVTLRKLQLVQYKMPQKIEKEYIDSLKQASTRTEADRIGKANKGTATAINWLNEIKETDYSKDYFHESYELFKTQCEHVFNRALPYIRLHHIIAIEKLNAIKALSSEHDRIKNECKGKIPSGHLQIAVINQAAKDITRKILIDNDREYLENLERVMALTMEKLWILRN